jgi:molecular chaperone HtpG
MRRMKEMQQTGGGGMMGNMPDMYNLVVNTNHELVGQILAQHQNPKEKRTLEFNKLWISPKLSQNLLKGEALTQFIQRSVELIK